MTMPAGLPAPRPDQGFTPAGSPMAPGSPNVVRARQVIISGANGSLYVYSGAPAAGTLIYSVVGAAGVDSFGNNTVPGGASYDDADGIATAVTAGSVTMYSGSLAGGWTQQAQIFLSPGGNIELIPAAGRGVITSNNTLDNGSGGATFNGNVTVVGTLNVNGSGSTANAGLPNGTISGTSGGASAGTAHTHGPGSFSVTNGNHNHVL